ncbi:MAG: hypothetical protein WBP94_02710 [Rhodomicrobiaceae bacterium]
MNPLDLVTGGANPLGGNTAADAQFEQQFEQKLSEAITTGGVIVGSQIMNQMLSNMADDPDAP